MLALLRPRRAPGSGAATRTWLRGAVRRPLRGVLVGAGIALMAVATVAALVAGDTLETLFLEDARARWGDTDVLVVQPGEALVEESLARLAGVEGGATAAGWAGRLVLDATAAVAGRREPQARVLGLSAEEQTMPGGARFEGRGFLDLLLLGPDEVIVNARLAERVGADVGDPIDLVLAVPEHVVDGAGSTELTIEPRAVSWRPTVVGIAEDRAVADLGRTPNVLARLDAVQRAADVPGFVSALHVASSQPGADASEALAEGFEDINRQVGLVAVEAKEAALDVAREEGGLFRGILVTLALLVVAAASAVTVNLVVLVGQERAREVAVLRALGTRRGVLARLLTAEAVAYAAVAAVVGAVVALPLARYLARAIADHFGGIGLGRGREQVELALEARPATVATGIVLVVLVAALAARTAGRRVAALDVEAVLRGGAPTPVPTPPGDRRVRWTRGSGLLLLGAGLTASDAGDLLRFTGLSLLLVAWWLQRRRAAGTATHEALQARSVLDERAALLGLAWCLGAPALLGDFAQGVQASFGILTLAGIGAVACATILAASRMPGIVRVLRLYVPGRRVQAPLRTAGSYAGYARARTGTVVGVIGVVLFMVAALDVLGSATDVAAEGQRGGFDAVGTATAPVDLEVLRTTPGAARVVGLSHVVMDETWFSVEEDDEDADGDARTVPYPVRAVEVDASFPTAQVFDVAAALPEYPTSAQLLDAVVVGEGVVLDRYARPEGAQPGDLVVIDDGRGPASFELLGVLDTFVLNGVFLGPADFTDLFRSRGPTFVLATGDQGLDAGDLARALEDAAADRGLQAASVAEAADEVVRINRTFTDVFALLLYLGLVVALVAVAVLVARGVRERRAALAVLRAVGFRRRDVGVLVLGEPVAQAVVGAAIGLGVGLGVLRLLFARGFQDLAFVVAWGRLGVGVAVVLAVVVLASAVPAVAGARRDPAAGLRDLG